MCPKGIRHQFLDQTEEKKEEGLRGWLWVDVSLGFPFGGLGEPNIYHNLGEFTRMWEGCGGVPVVNGVCETCEIVKR